MEILAILMADILFLALMVFAVRLERRILRAEERQRSDISRLTERLFGINRSVQALQDSIAAGAGTTAELDERAAAAEQQFVQAIEELMSYGAPKPAEPEVAK